VVHICGEPVERARSLSGRAQTCGRQPRQPELIANKGKPDNLSMEATKQHQTPATTSNPSESPNTPVHKKKGRGGRVKCGLEIHIASDEEEKGSRTSVPGNLRG
jgi:hypothetical protein